MPFCKLAFGFLSLVLLSMTIKACRGMCAHSSSGQLAPPLVAAGALHIFCPCAPLQRSFEDARLDR